METGALIEELDIKDLQEYLEVVKNENIKIVFENLLRESRNHLRAFNRQLEKSGVDILLFTLPGRYDQIVSSQNETGNQQRKAIQGGR